MATTSFSIAQVTFLGRILTDAARCGILPSNAPKTDDTWCLCFYSYVWQLIANTTVLGVCVCVSVFRPLQEIFVYLTQTLRSSNLLFCWPDSYIQKRALEGRPSPGSCMRLVEKKALDTRGCTFNHTEHEAYTHIHITHNHDVKRETHVQYVPHTRARICFFRTF